MEGTNIDTGLTGTVTRYGVQSEYCMGCGYQSIPALFRKSSGMGCLTSEPDIILGIGKRAVSSRRQISVIMRIAWCYVVSYKIVHVIKMPICHDGNRSMASFFPGLENELDGAPELILYTHQELCGTEADGNMPVMTAAMHHSPVHR